MTSRWWHHDDRDGMPARTAYDSSATSSAYRQQPAQQQYAMQSHSPMRPEAAEFKPAAQQSSAAPSAAPGFNRAGPAIAKAQLPKCWEYEDPLKDVHGPFDAAQIINWFAQDWFGTDLKIRRIGQYWTMLEYVLEELKAEARGTSAPSSTYTTAPQQLPQAATTPATSYGTQRSPAMSAPTASYGRPAAAVAGGGGIEPWGGPSSSSAGYQAAAAAEETWGSAGGPSSRSDRMMDRGIGSATAGGAAVQARPRVRAAEDYSNSGGFGSEDYSGVRGRGARDKEREAAAAAAAGVQFGTDGKWERGYVIEGESRRGGRSSRSYQDYDSYGDEYGSSSSRRGRGRGARSDRGADRYGEARETGSGYDRATKILEGADDDDYGGSARSRGRAAREGRGLGAGGLGGYDSSPAIGAGGSSRDSKQEGYVAARDPAAVAAKASRNKREGTKVAAVSKETPGLTAPDGKDAAAAVAAATAALGSIGLSGSGSSPASAPPAAVDVGTDGWGGIPATTDAVAADDGWGSTKAKPLQGKWGDEPIDSDSLTADELAAGPPAAPAVGLDSHDAGTQQQTATGDAAGAEMGQKQEAATDATVVPANHAATEHAANDAEDKSVAPAAAQAESAAGDVEPGAFSSQPAEAQPEPHSKAEEQPPSPPAAAPAEAPGQAPPAASSPDKPKLSKVQQLIMMQEQQLQQQEADRAKLSPGRNATPPRNPLRNSASAGSLTDHAAGANDTASPTAAGGAAAAGGSEDVKDVSSMGAADEPAAAAAPEAADDADLADSRLAKGAVQGASTAVEGGVKTVAGITAGIFSSVVGALMGSGSNSSISEGKAADKDDAHADPE